MNTFPRISPILRYAAALVVLAGLVLVLFGYQMAKAPESSPTSPTPTSSPQ